ncbi:MAG: hypothetical protein ABI222_17615 [Opitutaceae bacterium]
MKSQLRLLAVFLATTAAAAAAPLIAATAVHIKPDEASPTITVLNAGSEPVPTSGSTLANTPADWMAVELPGPFDGYVLNKDILKSLDVRVGAPIHLAPTPASGVLATMAKGDVSNITGLHGKWTQIRLQKKIIGYIRVSDASTYPAPTALATTTTTEAPGEPVSAPPVAPVAYGVTTAGRAVPMMNLGDGGSSTLPRLIQGKFVSTRSVFKHRRPYDWALDDDGGTRYAYLDISKLLLTEQLNKYIDRHVVIYGAAKSVPGGKDIVIVVESLQLK